MQARGVWGGWTPGRTAVERSHMTSSLVLLFLAVMRLPPCCELITSPVLRAPGVPAGGGRLGAALRTEWAAFALGVRAKARAGAGARVRVSGQGRGQGLGRGQRRGRGQGQGQWPGPESGLGSGSGRGVRAGRGRLHKGLLGALGLIAQPDLVAHLDLGCDRHVSAPARARPRALSLPVLQMRAALAPPVRYTPSGAAAPAAQL